MEPIWVWGVLGHLSAQACEKGHLWPRLHHLGEMEPKIGTPAAHFSK